LSINYIKTKFMVNGKKCNKNYKIKIGENEIEQVKEIKYLGVIFNDKLSWRPRIKHVCSKISSDSWALLKLRNYVDLNT